MAEMTVKVTSDIDRVVLDIQRASVTPDESPDLTTVPPAAGIRWQGAVYTITDGKQAAINGTPVANTSGVASLKLVKKPSNPPSLQPGVYQWNGAAWYGPVVTSTGGVELPAGDPSGASTPIPPPAGVPAPAAAVGYNTCTFGSEGLILGQNWRLFDLQGAARPGCARQLPNGALQLLGNGPNGYNAHCGTVWSAPGSPGWAGTSFGGGAYFEYVMKWDGAYQQQGGWPSVWGNEASRDGYGWRQWPGMSPGYKQSIEQDYFECWSGRRWGIAMHSWYHESDDFHPEVKEILMPEGTFNNFHKFGFLWVPSVGSKNGFAKTYFDDVDQDRNISWPPYDAAPRPPPTSLSVMDVTHQCLLLGTSAANPMTVSSFKVWQRDRGNNIIIP